MGAGLAWPDCERPGHGVIHEFGDARMPVAPLCFYGRGRSETAAFAPPERALFLWLNPWAEYAQIAASIATTKLRYARPYLAVSSGVTAAFVPGDICKHSANLTLATPAL